MAGLSCAVDLARQGVEVIVLERREASGGKMREVGAGGRTIDAGPTVLTMRWVFDEIFDAAGASLEQFLKLIPAEILARHAWSESERLDLFADLSRSAEAIGDFAGPGEARGYLAFCAEAEAIYKALRGTFLTEQLTGPIGLACRSGLRGLPALAAIRPFETLWSALGRHFHDPRLRQLFGRYATYCGSSPFAAPATLMLIAHVEREGVWLVAGGMQRLADSLAALAGSLGATIRYGAPVDEILTESGRATGVRLAGGERLAGAGVIVNADCAAIAGGLFGEDARRAIRPIEPADRSLSAIVWTLQARTGGFPLHRHNVFFAPDYAREFTDLFARGQLPRVPTIYVCAQDRPAIRGDGPGQERLMVLINAPPRGDLQTIDSKELAACQTRVLAHLSHCGLEVDPCLETLGVTTPDQFHQLFPASGGALYGRATHGWSAAFRRPGARTRIAGLYQAGGGAHPGAGAPMAALSGRLAARRLLKDLGSTRRSVPGAMSGGTLTR
jgi:1-hydroxycarotenoid 3,4-desaturase